MNKSKMLEKTKTGKPAGSVGNIETEKTAGSVGNTETEKSAGSVDKTETEKPIEILLPDNHEESRALWEQVFPEDEAPFLDAYYKGKGFVNEISVVRDAAGEICSMIHWNPVELMVRHQRVTVDFLVAVATREDMRRKGLMARLMQQGLEKRQKQGMPFVFLVPANEAYYTPFGFVTVGKSNRCPFNKIPQMKYSEEQQRKLEVRPLQTEEYENTAAWANLCLTASYTVFAVRSKTYFERLEQELASEGGHIMGVYRENTLIGLFLYTEGDSLEIREPICHKQDRRWVFFAIGSYFGHRAEEAFVLGWDKDVADVKVENKLMIRMLSPKRCKELFLAEDAWEQIPTEEQLAKTLFKNIYLHEVV